MNTAIDCLCDDDPHSIPLVPLTPEQLTAWCADAHARDSAWVEASAFEAKPGSVCLLPDETGHLRGVLVGGDPVTSPFVLGDLAKRLPPGCYRLENGPEATLDGEERMQAMLGFVLGAYRFARYRNGGSGARGGATERGVSLQAPDGAAGAELRAQAAATYLARDLINTPAVDMMPGALADAARALASEFGASVQVVEGDALLREGFPAIHAVGRASAHPPRLIRLEWGREDAPRVALVGKGVCFDSGGLDIKPAAGMRLMKKDMGGAAHALALARLIMETGLDLHLDVLVPAVENAIAGNAMRPGDVVPTRKGLNVEIDNTDAEGRVILCDALALAAESEPALIIDFATLTGAARVAVGTEIAAMFCNDDDLAAGILEAAGRTADPVWRMPLYAPYRKLFESKIADLANSGGTPYAGAITAALFLERFVPDGCPWAHFDIMAWNTRARPGHPEGGEAMGMRATYAYLKARFGA